MDFAGGTRVKEPISCCRRHKETQVLSLGQEDPLEEGMATHSSIISRRILWTKEPDRLYSVAKSQTRLKADTMHVWCQVLWKNTESFPLKDLNLEREVWHT